MKTSYNGNLSELVIQAQSGSREAFAKLYDRTYQAQFYTAISILKNNQLAQDAVQDAYLCAMEHLNQLKHPEGFIVWLKQITYRCCLAALKVKAKHPAGDSNDVLEFIEDETPAANPVTRAIKSEKREAILSKLNSLSEEHRSIVFLRYYHDLKLKEIAKLKGISVGTAKSRLHYAQKQLKLLLEAEGFGNGIWSIGILLYTAMHPHLRPPLRNFKDTSARKMQAGAAAASFCILLVVGAVGPTPASVVPSPVSSGHTGPYIARYDRSPGKLHLFLEAPGSAIDFASLSLTEANGRTVPASVGSRENGEVILTYPENGEITLSVLDTAGRRLTEALYPADTAY